MTRFASIAAVEVALADLGEPDAGAAADARVRQGELTEPAGSLGRLEDLAIFFAGWQGRARPRIERARAAIFAGNHGVTVHGVSAFPQIGRASGRERVCQYGSNSVVAVYLKKTQQRTDDDTKHSTT